MEVKKIVEGMTAPQVAQVIDDNFKAQNEILEEDIAKQNNVIGVSEYKDFSEAEAVNVGDVRKYEGFLYECVEATTGAFDASKWKKSSFKKETEAKLSELGSLSPYAIKYNNAYIDYHGELKDENGMFVSEKFMLKAGQTLHIIPRKASGSYTVLAKCDEEQTNFTSLLRYKGNDIQHSYYAENDIIVCFCGKHSGVSIYIDTLDQTPIDGSKMPISSGGVKTAIDSLNKKITGEEEVTLNKTQYLYLAATGKIMPGSNTECMAVFPINAGDEVKYSSTVKGTLGAIGYTTNPNLSVNDTVEVKSSASANGEVVNKSYRFTESGYCVVSGNYSDLKVIKLSNESLIPSISIELDSAKNAISALEGKVKATQEDIEEIDIIVDRIEVSLDKDNNNKSILVSTGEIVVDYGYIISLPIYIDTPCRITCSSECGADSAQIALYSSNDINSSNYIAGVKGLNKIADRYIDITTPCYAVFSFVYGTFQAAYKDKNILYLSNNSVKQGSATILTIDENPQDTDAPISHVASASSVSQLNKYFGFSSVVLDKEANKGHYIDTQGKESIDDNQTYCYIPVNKGDKVFCYSNPDGSMAVISFVPEKSLEGLTIGVLSTGQREVTYFESYSPIDGYAIVGGIAKTLSAGKISASKDSSVLSPFKGTLKEVKSYIFGNSFSTKAKNKYVSIQQSIIANVNNYNGELPLLVLKKNSRTLRIVLKHSTPSNILLPQKENTEREQDIKYVDFPMAVKQDHIAIEIDGVETSSIILDGRVNIPFVRRVPALTIQYIPEPGIDLSTMTDLRMYITKGEDNIVDKLYIKKGDTVIYNYSFDSSRDIALVWKDIREGLESIPNYKFKLLFGDLDNSNVSDILCTKEAGLPFVTEYSSNCRTTGETVYDNYAVFIEALDKDLFELEAVVNNGTLRLFIEGKLIYTGTFDFNLVEFRNDCTSKHIIEYDPYYTKANGKRPLIRGLSGHEFSTQPIPTNRADAYEDVDGTGLGTPIGAVTYLAHQLRNKGWSNVSIDDVTSYMIDKNYNMPEKCYFIEMDDLGGRTMVNKIFSEEEPYQRQMEIIKMNGIKMCYALMLGADYDLFKKIYNGTATDEEKARLTTQMPNEYVYKLRSMINSYGWGVSLHTFVGPVTHVTAARYDDVVLSIRNSIKWVERMLGYTPRSYVTDLTGNSSPYFRRVMQMFGIQRVYHDDITHYSQGRLEGYVDRDGFYYKTDFQDGSY